MKVLFLTHCYPRNEGDGIGVFIHNLAKGMLKAGHQIYVLAPHAPGLPYSEIYEGIVIRRFRYGSDNSENLAYGADMAGRVKASLSGVFRFLILILEWRRALKDWHREVMFDGIHVHWWIPAGFVAAITAPRLVIPYGITFHGTDVRLASKYWLARLMLVWVIRKSRGVAAVSSYLAENLLRWADLSIPICPMPIGAEYFTDPEKQVQKNFLSLLVVASLTKQKRVDDAIRVFGVVAKYNSELRLIIVGDGVEKENLERLVANLGVQDKVKFAGRVAPNRMCYMFDQAAIFMLLSEGEGCGLVAAEAMARHLPVIVTNDGGLADFRNGGAKVVPLGDQVAAVAAIKDLVGAEGNALKGNVAKGYMFVKQTFHPDAVADVYVTQYQKWFV